MINDGEKEVGIAGIMGGENSKITDDVKTMVFEAACFDGTNIRLSAKKIGLRTDASGKFEKGLDPNNAKAAIDRACQLIEELGAGEVVGGTVDVYPEVRKEVRVPDVYKRQLLERGRTEEAEELFLKFRETEKRILEKFKKEQDIFVRIDWYGNVLYSHEVLLKNIQLLKGAAENLEEGKLSAGLRKLYQVDNNAYAFMFDKEVYSHFTEYVLNQPEDRLKWGYKRLMEHENLYDLVKNLLKKQGTEKQDFKEETDYLKYVCARQKGLFLKTIEKLCKEVENTFLDLAVKDKIQ